MDEESIPESAFTTVFRKFDILRLPFSLSQDSDFFCSSHLQPFGLDKTPIRTQAWNTLAYLDDILIHSKMDKEHVDMINYTFECLQKAGLKIKLSKCLFFKKQIHYLGHLVSRNAILPLTDKLEALMKLTPPLTSKKLDTFLVLKATIENSYISGSFT